MDWGAKHSQLFLESYAHRPEIEATIDVKILILFVASVLVNVPRLALNLSTSTVHVSDQKGSVNVPARDFLFVVAANAILNVC